MKKNVIVVGGGILGIFCSLYYKKKIKTLRLLNKTVKLEDYLIPLSQKMEFFTIMDVTLQERQSKKN